MTDEIMPKEAREEKILAFFGGCLTGILWVFTVAVMSELLDMSSRTTSSDESENDGEKDEFLAVSDSSTT